MEARREAAAIRELTGLAQDDRVLDLGCGWGRHLGLLRGAGHDVTGVDRPLPLLRLARAEDTGAAGRLVAGDMRRLPFGDGAFDAVLNVATSLGLFLDDAEAVRALGEARRVVRPRGRLLLEGMHRDDVVTDYAARDRWLLDDGTAVRARRRFDALAGVSHEVLRWRRADGGEGRKRHSLRLRTATEVAGLLEAAGWAVEAAFGDWDGAPFRHDAPRLIFLATAGR
ncbi:MAG: class I SAM-dependent methyltransferase [Gemmatimonadota bacterium]